MLLIKKLIIITLILLIFEGAIRKWILPMLAAPLIFARDPLLIAIYWLAFKERLWAKVPKILTYGFFALSITWVIVGFLQIILRDYEPMALAFGLRQYLWNIPLAFIIGVTFKPSDLIKVCKIIIVTAMFMAPLVILQYKSPPTAWINKSPVEDGFVFRYGPGQGLVRTTGTFTFCYGLQLYAHLAFCIVLALWLLPPKQNPTKKWHLVAASVAAIVMVLLNGNRGVFICAAWSLAYAVAGASFIHSNVRKTFLKVLLIGLPLAIGIYVGVFPDAYENMRSRVTETENSESSVDRLSKNVTLLGDLSTITSLGKGIGAGTNGSTRFLPASKRVAEEREWPRIFSEVGPIGLLFITLEILFSGWLTVAAFKASQRTHNALPIMLASFESCLLLGGQVVGNNTASGFAWIVAGLCIAANQIGTMRVPQTLPVERPR